MRIQRTPARTSDTQQQNLASPVEATSWREFAEFRQPDLAHSLVIGPKGSQALIERHQGSVGRQQSPAENGTETVEFQEKPSLPATPGPPVEYTRARFLVLGSWEGVVLEVTNETFIARLTDIHSGRPDEIAEFHKSDLSGSDLELLEPEAIFYWFVGYNDNRSGQRARSSILRFRRLPAWTPEEDEQARAWAHEAAQILWRK